MNQQDDLIHHLQQTRRQMAAVVWRVLRDADQADDALQNALLRIWKMRREVTTHSNPPALIVRICFQAAMDLLRQRIRNHTEPIPASLTDKTRQPLDGMIDMEAQDQVLFEIAKLPHQQAEAIYLRVIERLSYDEVAAVLGCTASTTRGHVRRARETLRQRLASSMSQEVCYDSQ